MAYHITSAWSLVLNSFRPDTHFRVLFKISIESTVKKNNPPETPKTNNGIIQMLMMDKPTGQKG